MRKKLISILSAVCVCLLMLFYAAACQEKNVPQRQESGTDVILRLDKSSLNMDLYDKYQFNVQYSGEETLQWSSSDEGIVKLDGQQAEAVGIGSAVVRVAAGEKSAECIVVVSDEELGPLMQINLPDDSCTLIAGDSFTLIPSILFNGVAYTDGTFSYSAEGNAVTVTQDGTIHASGQGTAMLTVSAEWRNFGPEYLSRQIMVEVLA